MSTLTIYSAPQQGPIDVLVSWYGSMAALPYFRADNPTLDLGSHPLPTNTPIQVRPVEAWPDELPRLVRRFWTDRGYRVATSTPAVPEEEQPCVELGQIGSMTIGGDCDPFRVGISPFDWPGSLVGDGVNDVGIVSSAPLVAQFNSAGPLQFAFWARVDTHPVGTTEAWILSAGGAGNIFLIGFVGTSGSSRLYCSRWYDGAARHEVRTDAAISSTDWHHYVVQWSFDGTANAVYIDGSLVATSNIATGDGTFSALPGSTVSLFGHLGLGRNLAGALADIQAGTYLMSAAEVSTFWNSGAGRPPSHNAAYAAGLFAHWPLNDGSGTTATDIVGGYNASLQNFTGNFWIAPPAI